MTEPLTKVCQNPDCNQEKPIDEFYKKKGYKDGRAARCKECLRAYFREYSAAHRDYYRETWKEWKLRNPEKAKEHNKRACEKYRAKKKAEKEAGQ
ncbi:hypothetical protein [Rhodococcus opacus]|uniref:hypothetical protein n=1 Tax=Rhodococcus opacus TaxID=37919 RepID=UPI001009B0FA|nr:hypothetical protein [Rhodococcus opacus]